MWQRPRLLTQNNKSVRLPLTKRFPTIYCGQWITDASGQQESLSRNEKTVTVCPKRRYTVELLNVGGNANNGANCGVSYANSNNAFSNSNTNIGARLKFYTINKKLTLSFWGTRLSLLDGGSNPDRANTRGVGYESQDNRVPSRK